MNTRKPDTGKGVSKNSAEYSRSKSVFTPSISPIPHLTTTDSDRSAVPHKHTLPTTKKTENNIPSNTKTSLKTIKNTNEEIELDTRGQMLPPAWPTVNAATPLTKIPRHMLITDSLDYLELLFSSQRIPLEGE